MILPFTIGVYFLATHQYMLDPVLAYLGFSEYVFMQYYRVREPFVRHLLMRRATMCMAWVAVIDAALCCLFIFVPSTRL